MYEYLNNFADSDLLFPYLFILLCPNYIFNCNVKSVLILLLKIHPKMCLRINMECLNIKCGLPLAQTTAIYFATRGSTIGLSLVDKSFCILPLGSSAKQTVLTEMQTFYVVTIEIKLQYLKQ